MGHERAEQNAEAATPQSLTIVTVHGERATLWHIVDPSVPEDDQPAVLRTFSSLAAMREEVDRFLRESPLL